MQSVPTEEEIDMKLNTIVQEWLHHCGSNRETTNIYALLQVPLYLMS